MPELDLDDKESRSRLLRALEALNDFADVDSAEVMSGDATAAPGEELTDQDLVARLLGGLQALSTSTKLTLARLAGADAAGVLTIAELLDWADEKDSAAIWSNCEYRAPTRTLARVEAPHAHGYAMQLSLGEQTDLNALELRWGTTDIVCRLRNDVTALSLQRANDGAYGDFSPSYSDSELTLEILHPQSASRSEVAEAMRAYLFELTASYDLLLTVVEFPDVEPSEEWDEMVEAAEARSSVMTAGRLRPLMRGRGLDEARTLFLEADSVASPTFQVLGFVKVLECVSATVVRREAHAQLRRRLMDPEALDPDAIYLQGLIELASHLDYKGRDREAIILTIQTCCDSDSLRHRAAAFLPGLRSISDQSREGDKQAALRELAVCLSATRNQIVHAKANYHREGSEAPSEMLPELAAIARVAAIQAIRWLCDLPEHARVAGPASD